MPKFLKNVLWVVLVQIVAYLLLFVVYPCFLFTSVDIIIMWLTFALVAVMCAVLIAKTDCSWLELLIGVIPMWILAYLYHPHSLFGISDGTGLDAFSAKTDALIFAMCLYIGQLIIKLIIKLCRALRSNKNN